ncbi:toll/interleukin-1 receptor domain-containing protein [Luteitalea pratensis]|uniref:toll/interleukin-1 receptor domain-containing protein n=1 Tax=Luteitalea pratensis TaxID=1855912 RepID=UPI0013903412|nr:toll/interleukin-1 receptor domain-containing protein [Luteitalea pratensis]
MFISYVRADADKIDKLALDLYRHGIDTWTDRDLRPGQRWKVTIRQAIRQGASFLACFSPEVFKRDRTYMYEEITSAIEVLRETPADRTWFIPVRLDSCEVPELDIGAGMTLRDFQWVDVFPDWEAGVNALVSAIRPSLTRQALLPSRNEPRLPPLRFEPGKGVSEAWRLVWTALFQLKVAGDALLTCVDDHNLRRYAGLLDAATSKVGEFAFYFDRDDFEQLEVLLHGALTFSRGKRDVRDYALLGPTIDGTKLDEIRRVIEVNLNEFEQFSQVLEGLRDRYAVRTAAAPGHPVSSSDARSRRKVSALSAAAVRSRSRAEIRRAAEALVRRGEVTLTTDCPRGHGTLREWDGLPRCWECGWPWK